MERFSGLAGYIDHTNLKPEAVSRDIALLCDEAMQHGFYSVCVNPYWVSFAKDRLKGLSVQVCTVVGFPLGGNCKETKVEEAQRVSDLEADEIDMVMNIGAAKEGRWDVVYNEVNAVVEAASGKCVKVILETCLLTKEEIITACKRCEQAGAHFVKTSTGFNKEGATIEAVSIMRSAISSSIGLKAAGGIRDKDTAQAMIDAGATRIGASASIAIVS